METTTVPECYLDTLKRCPNSPTTYCHHRGNLVQCIHTKTCVVPEPYRKHSTEDSIDD